MIFESLRLIYYFYYYYLIYLFKSSTRKSLFNRPIEMSSSIEKKNRWNIFGKIYDSFYGISNLSRSDSFGGASLTIDNNKDDTIDSTQMLRLFIAPWLLHDWKMIAPCEGAIST